MLCHSYLFESSQVCGFFCNFDLLSTSCALNHLSVASAISPGRFSTYFLEIINKTPLCFTLSTVLHERRCWSYGNETLISHALQSAAFRIILAAAAKSLPPFTSVYLLLPLSSRSSPLATGILPFHEYPR